MAGCAGFSGAEAAFALGAGVGVRLAVLDFEPDDFS